MDADAYRPERQLRRGSQNWGPIIWRTMHSMALCYPGRIRQPEFETFYTVIARMIPCHTCSTLYMEKIRALPMAEYMDDSVRLFSWTVEIHNRVNASLGKPRMTVDDAYKLY